MIILIIFMIIYFVDMLNRRLEVHLLNEPHPGKVYIDILDIFIATLAEPVRDYFSKYPYAASTNRRIVF